MPLLYIIYFLQAYFSLYFNKVENKEWSLNFKMQQLNLEIVWLVSCLEKGNFSIIGLSIQCYIINYAGKNVIHTRVEQVM